MCCINKYNQELLTTLLFSCETNKNIMTVVQYMGCINKYNQELLIIVKETHHIL